MNTIVSAFISNINNRQDVNLNLYYNWGKLLFQCDVPKVIFVDIPMYNLIQKTDYDETITKIIIIDKSSIYLYDYIDNITNFDINTNNKHKDTIEFMFIMCEKTEWLRQAINMNPFNTNHFVWLDFGLKHVFKCSDDEFIQKINKMIYKIYDQVRIGNIWNLNIHYNCNIYKDITWYFAGGVVGGHRDSLIQFANLVKNNCIDIMINKKTIIWEVNIWYLVYNLHKNLFDPYYCDHDYSICDNF